MRNIIGVLVDFRSVYNTASCFRTADGAGVEKLYLVGTTPAPLDRFGLEREDFKKVSLGAEKTVEWERRDDFKNMVKKLRGDGFVIVAVEQDKRAEDIFDFREEGERRLALVFGNEVKGLENNILEQCDRVVKIPMRGEKESLNVAVAFGVSVFLLK